ncbi:hypothetical protein MRO93_21620, partial [Dickeya dianthicola]
FLPVVDNIISDPIFATVPSGLWPVRGGKKSLKMPELPPGHSSSFLCTSAIQQVAYKIMS